jgi:hypothetical protein
MAATTAAAQAETLVEGAPSSAAESGEPSGGKKRAREEEEEEVEEKDEQEQEHEQDKEEAPTPGAEAEPSTAPVLLLVRHCFTLEKLKHGGGFMGGSKIKGMFCVGPAKERYRPIVCAPNVCYSVCTPIVFGGVCAAPSVSHHLLQVPRNFRVVLRGSSGYGRGTAVSLEL